MRFANQETNLTVLEELVKLFRARRPIPGDDEFAEITPRLADYTFPRRVFTDALLAAALVPGRVARIREGLLAIESGGEMIRYEPAWKMFRGQRPKSIDLILSQAVLEHVDDLKGTYGRYRVAN